MPDVPAGGVTSSRSPSAAHSGELRGLGNLLSHPLVRRRGPIGAVLGLIRRVVLGLARSWLHVQTRFNQAMVDQLEGLRDELAVSRDQLERSQAALAAIARELQEQRARQSADSAALDGLRDVLLDQIRTMAHEEVEALQALRTAVTRSLEPLERAAVIRLGSHLEARLAVQERRLTWLLDELRRGGPMTDPERSRLLGPSKPADQDALYAFLEEAFRGDRGEIKERARVYLPALAQVPIGPGDAAILDLGCGRGEWLELLRDEGWRGRGVDLNRVFLDDCRQRGLDVVEADVLGYLAAVPDGSIPVVTAIHLIEHLPFDAMVTLIDELLRVLKPGGLAILETPNPENVLVSTYKFHLDPTHHKPIPSRLLSRVLDGRGFERVDVLKLQPEPGTAMVEESGLDVAGRFNAYFHGPRDYAVLAWKPRPAE